MTYQTRKTWKANESWPWTLAIGCIHQGTGSAWYARYLRHVLGSSGRRPFQSQNSWWALLSNKWKKQFRYAINIHEIRIYSTQNCFAENPVQNWTKFRELVLVIQNIPRCYIPVKEHFRDMQILETKDPSRHHGLNGRRHWQMLEWDFWRLSWSLRTKELTQRLPA